MVIKAPTGARLGPTASPRPIAAWVPQNRRPHGVWGWDCSTSMCRELMHLWSCSAAGRTPRATASPPLAKGWRNLQGRAALGFLGHGEFGEGFARDGIRISLHLVPHPTAPMGGDGPGARPHAHPGSALLSPFPPFKPTSFPSHPGATVGGWHRSPQTRCAPHHPLYPPSPPHPLILTSSCSHSQPKRWL